jgi:hypothetical protein
MTSSEDKMKKCAGTSRIENSEHKIFLKLHNGCMTRQQV